MPIESASEGSFGHLARAAGKMMDQMQKGFFIVSPDTWTPNVNLYETATSYFVCVDLAGVDKAKIDVEVADGRLTLRGNRPVPSPDEVDAAAAPPASAALPASKAPPAAGAGTPVPTPSGGHHASGGRPASAAAEGEAAGRRAKVHLMEIDHGQFSRDVDLPPDADPDTISANYRNGMLWVEIPKK
jgi:HSP20 family molecular chaperone IbpA